MAERNGLPWRGPGDGRPAACRCRPGRCRCAAAGAGASAGATSAASATSSCSAPPASRSGRWARPSGRSATARAGEALGEHAGCCCRAPAATSGPSTRRGEEVVAELGDVGILDYAPDEGSLVRIDIATSATWATSGRSCASAAASGSRRSARPRTASTSGRASASTCRSTCDVRIGDRRWRFEAPRRRGRVRRLPPPPHGLELVGRRRRTADGRSVGWNLVSGINDPPRALGARDLGRRRAERAGAGELRRPRGDQLRRRLAPRLHGRVRAPQGAEPAARPSTPTGSRSAPSAARFPAGSSSSAALGVMEHHDATGSGPSRIAVDLPAPWRLLAGRPSRIDCAVPSVSSGTSFGFGRLRERRRGAEPRRRPLRGPAGDPRPAEPRAVEPVVDRDRRRSARRLSSTG